jgi:hypothetical protein
MPKLVPFITLCLDAAVGSTSRSCLPPPDSVLKVLGSTMIPPALQPNYSYNWDPVNTPKFEDMHTSRPYAPSDKLVRSGNPVTTSFRCTPNVLPRAGVAMRRLGEKSIMFRSLFDSVPLNRNIANVVASSPASVDMDSLRCVISPVDYISELPLTTPTTETYQSLPDSLDLLGAMPQKPGNDAVLFDREPLLPIDPDFSDDEGDDGSTDSNFTLFEPLHETARLSATEQVDDTVTTLYFEREPFAEIDSDFSEDEEEESDNIKILSKLVAPSTPLRETNLGFEVDVAVMQDAVEVFESDNSSTVESELPSTTSRCTSASSRISQSSTEFHMDNTFLGTTSARDFIDRVRMNEEGKATKKVIAQAWVLCVAAEHADWRSVSSSVNIPGISFIT